jgi:DNA polymerase III subunit beta
MTTIAISATADALAIDAITTRAYKQLLQGATSDDINGALAELKASKGKNKTRIKLLESRLEKLQSSPESETASEPVVEAVAEVIDELIEVTAEAIEDEPAIAHAVIPATAPTPEGITASVVFTVESAALARVTKNLRPFAQHSSHEVLNHIRIQTETDGLELTAFDLSSALQCHIPANIKLPGSLLIPAEFLATLSAQLPAESIVVTWDAEAGFVYFQSSVGEHKVRGMAADDFPELPTIEGQQFSMPMDILQRAIRYCGISVGRDESRQVLTALHVAGFGKETQFAATDGHRLSRMTVPLPIFPDKFSINIPRSALPTLSGFDGEDESLELEIGGNDFAPAGEIAPTYNYLKATNSKGSVFITRLIEAQYPNYNQLLPRRFDVEVRVSRQALHNAAARADLCDGNNIVRLDFSPEKVAITASSEGVSGAAESLPCDANTNLTIAFNARYLMAVCPLAGDEVWLRMNTPKSPAVIVIPTMNYEYLIMPVELRR